MRSCRLRTNPIIVSPPATKKSRRIPRRSDRTPPRVGPIMPPIENILWYRATFRCRCKGGACSPTYINPAVIENAEPTPTIIRETTSSRYEDARPAMICELRARPVPKSKRLRRPRRSAKTPPGISTNTRVNPNADITNPIKAYDTSKEAMYTGKTGSTTLIDNAKQN